MFAQRLLNRCLAPAPRLPERLLKDLALSIRWAIIKRRDPLVTFEIQGVTLTLPLSHGLPFALTEHPGHDFNLGRVAAAVRTKYPDLKVVDVGANVGDTAAILRLSTPVPVLAIEGDEAFFKLLVQNMAPYPDVVPVQALMGASQEAISAEFRREQGTARVVSGTGSRRMTTLAALIDEHPEFAAAKLLKVDTDGFDGAVLDGARPWLGQARPVLFFEYDPRLLKVAGYDSAKVLSRLLEAGYRRALVFDKHGTCARSLALDDAREIAEVGGYYSGQNERYCDLCAFHDEDADLFEQLWRSELAPSAPEPVPAS